MKPIEPSDFITAEQRRVLTDAGSPGMDGKEGIGSTTERSQGQIAAAIYANAGELDSQQIEDLISWLRLYQQ
ncbi:hypothetical protein [Stutzerimonas zhaodongensis]|uniref:hypothetical protein n=1 Tax=Stutzerimonas zhaodongensis TaxID=1176257 RepID=UPI002104A904|nr:hypothetical protein [Stutzerimonas zhaodongensis]MCQ2032250.1 hypothetical protein [Stutzerimonas zhaodongensis]